MNIIKEFLEWRKIHSSFNYSELSELDKTEINTINKDVLEKILNQTLIKLSNDMINDNLSSDYVRGYKHGASIFLSYIRKYFKK